MRNITVLLVLLTAASTGAQVGLSNMPGYSSGEIRVADCPDFGTDRVVWTMSIGAGEFLDAGADIDGNLYVVFNNGLTADLHYIKSTDGGATWVELFSWEYSGAEVRNLDLEVVSSTDTTFLAYIWCNEQWSGSAYQTGIEALTMTTSGAIINDLFPLWPGPPDVDLHPRIISDAGYESPAYLYTCYLDSNLQTLSERSVDYGVSYGSPQVVDAGPDRDPALVVLDDGVNVNLFVGYTDEGTGHTSVKQTTRSFGSFGSAVSIEADSQPDSELELAALSDTTVIGVYAEDYGGGDMDVDWSSSTDEGATWAQQSALAASSSASEHLLSATAHADTFAIAYCDSSASGLYAHVRYTTLSTMPVWSAESGEADNPVTGRPVVAYAPTRGFFMVYPSDTTLYIDVEWTIDVDDRDVAILPENVTLSVAPNPFNPTTAFSFDLPEPGRARVEVFDILGRSVAVLLDESLSAGRHSVHWDASGYASGVYLARVSSEAGSATARAVLLK
jgi:hypothetical protein